MALTRKLLKSMGIDEEKIDQIIEAHTETVDALKEERDSYKEDAVKLPAIQKELEEAQKTIDANGKDAFKVKYAALKDEFDTFKADLDAKATKATKEKAYIDLLKETGVSEKRIPAIIKVSNIESIELGEDGKIKDAEKLSESIKNEWSDFIQTTETHGATTPTPPSGTTDDKSYDDMSMAEYVAARKKRG